MAVIQSSIIWIQFHQILGVLAGDLKNEDDILKWLSHQVSSEEIEDVNDEMMDMLIGRLTNLAVLFCKFTDLFNQKPQDAGCVKPRVICVICTLKYRELLKVWGETT